MSPENGDWLENRKLVLSKLDEVCERLDGLENTITADRIEAAKQLTTLKENLATVQRIVYGAVGLGLTSLFASLLRIALKA